MTHTPPHAMALCAAALALLAPPAPGQLAQSGRRHDPVRIGYYDLRVQAWLDWEQ